MKEFDQLWELVKLLRTECPWDAKQTFETSREHVVEEARELHEALGSQNWEHIQEEWGDVFFNLLFVCNLAREAGHFDMAQALKAAHDKMVRRHPHVFGDVEANTPEEALKAFLDAKAKERE